MDILAVGNSVGIGSVSLMIGDSLAKLGVTEQDSLNNGVAPFLELFQKAQLVH